MFSAVLLKNEKEIARSRGMNLEEALKLAKRLREKYKEKVYVEETRTVKHLPLLR